MRNLTDKILRSRAGLVCAVLLLGFAAHAWMLPAPFKTLDDTISIVNNPDIRDFANTAKIFRSSFFGDGHYYRPLVSFSYMIEYHLFGLRPFFYNLTNLILHLAVAATVFFLVILVLKDRAVAFFASLLFAVHPVQWEAVSNIPGRAVILSALFTLNAFLFFGRCLGNARPPAGGRRRFAVFYGLSLACFTCGLLSKESAAMLPVLLAGYIFFVEKDARRYPLLLPFLLLILVYAAARRSLGIAQTYPWRSAHEYLLGFLTFLRASLTYLRLLVWPVDLHFDRARALFTSYRDPQLWATLLVFLASGAALWKAGKRLPRPCLFFLAWFWIELFPVSQLVTTIGVSPGYISTAEHFLYTPAVGAFVLLALAGRGLYRAAQRKRLCEARAGRFVLAGIFLFLMLITASQGLRARTALAMFRQSLARNPHNTRVLYSTGIEMANRERFREAERFFRRALNGDPQHREFRIALGRALCDQGRVIEGIAVYEAIKDAGKWEGLLKKNLDEAYQTAVARYQDRIARDPGNAQAYYSLGTIYSRSNRVEDGIEQYEKAVALDPRHRNALFNLASSYEALGRQDEAIEYYERVLAVGGTGEQDFIGRHARARLAEMLILAVPRHLPPPRPRASGGDAPGEGDAAKAQGYFEKLEGVDGKEQEEVRSKK